MDERDDDEKTLVSRPGPIRHQSHHREDAEYSIPIGRTLADVECELILETLKHCLGNRTHAAKILGISIRTLRNKLNEYVGDGLNIPPPANGMPVSVRGAA